MNFNGRIIFILVLLGFWLFMAYRAFSRGDSVLALVFLVTGVALTAWRLNSAKV